MGMKEKEKLAAKKTGLTVGVLVGAAAMVLLFPEFMIPVVLIFILVQCFVLFAYTLYDYFLEE